MRKITGLVVAGMLGLAACSDEGPRTIPGFERLGGAGPVHYVFADPAQLSDVDALQAAAQDFCEDKGALCRVMIWRDRAVTPTGQQGFSMTNLSQQYAEFTKNGESEDFKIVQGSKGVPVP